MRCWLRRRAECVPCRMHFMYSDFERDSGFLQQGRNHDNRRKVTAALNELVNRRVLYGIFVRKDGT